MDNKQPSSSQASFDFDSDQGNKQDLHNSLSEIYLLLVEEDMWAGLWQRNCYYRDTAVAVAYEQHGFFEQALNAYEACMARHKQVR